MDKFSLGQAIISSIGTFLILWAGILLERWNKRDSVCLVFAGLVMIVTMGRLLQILAENS